MFGNNLIDSSSLNGILKPLHTDLWSRRNGHGLLLSGKIPLGIAYLPI
jgi:hypothetical protein